MRFLFVMIKERGTMQKALSLNMCNLKDTTINILLGEWEKNLAIEQLKGEHCLNHLLFWFNILPPCADSKL